MRVEVDPVARALAKYGLDHAEVMQAGERRRPRIGARQGNEIDVVDGEIAVAVDEVDQAVADAVDAGDVELHRGGARAARSPCAAAGRRRPAAGWWRIRRIRCRPFPADWTARAGAPRRS